MSRVQDLSISPREAGPLTEQDFKGLAFAMAALYDGNFTLEAYGMRKFAEQRGIDKYDHVRYLVARTATKSEVEPSNE